MWLLKGHKSEGFKNFFTVLQCQPTKLILKQTKNNRREMPLNADL